MAGRRGTISIVLLLFAHAATFAGEIEIDGSTATTLDRAPNGVPVVNIANPNERGLSHNRYRRFGVEKQGLILNNADRTSVDTRLGGQIYGNPALDQPAEVILNEVTGTLPSSLRGYTEVAGPKSDVVIANPNGISVNGAGFINSSRVTLTTGSPLIGADGSLEGFDVRSGNVAVSGEGLDASQADALDVYSRALELNAAVHARELEVVLGSNRIDYPDRKITRRIGGSPPTVSLDSSALGGMYANKIRLVGTDQGLGMNLPPEVVASYGDIEIDADGKLRLQGLNSGGNIRLAGREIESSATVYAQGAIDIDAGERLAVVEGLIGAGSALDVRAERIDNDATIVTGLNADGSHNDKGILQLDTGQLASRGELAATRSIDIDARRFDNDGSLRGGLGGARVSADLTVNRGLLASDGSLVISGEKLVNRGELAAGIEHDSDAPEGDIAIVVTDGANSGVIHAGSSLDIAASQFDNDGVIRAGVDNDRGRIAIDVESIRNRGDLLGGDALQIDAVRMENDGRVGAGADNDRGRLVIDAESIENRGDLLGSETLDVAATRLHNDGLLQAGTKGSPGRLVIDAQFVGNRGELLGSKAIDIGTAQIDNHGQVRAGLGGERGQLAIHAESIANDGELLGTVGLDLVASKIANRGIIGAGYDESDNLNPNAHLFIDTDALTNDGSIASTAAIAIATIDMENRGDIAAGVDADGKAGRHGKLEISAENLTNDGMTLSSGAVVIDAGLIDNAGQLVAAVGTPDANAMLAIEARGITSSGEVIGAAGIAMTANDIENRGRLLAGVDSEGAIATQADLAIVAGALSNDGLALSTGAADIAAEGFENAGSLVAGIGTLIGAVAALTIESGSIANTGDIIGANDIALAAAVLDNRGRLLAGVDVDGEYRGHADLRVTADYTVNSAAMIASGGLIVEGDSLDNFGRIAAGVTPEEPADDALVVSVGQLINDADMTAATLVELGADRLVNRGTIAAGIDAAGDVLPSGRLQLSAAHMVNEGKLASAGNLTLLADELHNRGLVDAGLQTALGPAARLLAIDATRIVNDKEIYSSGRVDATALEVLNRGLVGSGENLRIGTRRLTNEATLFSGGNASLLIADLLSNRPGATLLAVGNLSLAADDLGARTARIDNERGLIQTLDGDINIAAEEFQNRGTAVLDYDIVYHDLAFDRIVSDPLDARKLDLEYSTGYTDHRRTARLRWESEIRGRLNENAPALYSSVAPTISVDREAVFLAIETRLVDRSVSNPAWLDSGRDLELNVGEFTNRHSVTAAARDIEFSISGSYKNEALVGVETVTDYLYTVRAEHDSNSFDENKYSSNNLARYLPVEVAKSIATNSVTHAGRDIRGEIGGELVNEGVVSGDLSAAPDPPPTAAAPSGGDTDFGELPDPTFSIAGLPEIEVDGIGSTRTPGSSFAATDTGISIPNLPSGGFGLFVRSPSPAGEYLIETNPRFTDPRRFLSSSYLLDRLDFSGQRTLKRLGDALFEQKLIRDSVFAQTGRRFLAAGVAGDEAQFRYLMDNAIAAQAELELSPGIALSRAQIDRLTRDIVWLEPVEFDGQTALAPRVYLAPGPKSRVRGGRIVAGGDVALQVASLVNAGLIETTGDLALASETGIDNRGELRAGATLQLDAIDDIVNLSGLIYGVDVDIESRLGSIVNRRDESEVGYRSHDTRYQQTRLGEAASITALESLSLRADRDIRVVGSRLAADNMNLDAGRIDIGAAAATEHYFSGDSKNHSHRRSRVNEASEVQGGDILIRSGGETRIAGSRISAEDRLTVESGNISIAAVVDEQFQSQLRSDSDLFGDSTETRRRFRAVSSGSELSGTTVRLVTGHGEITLTGSTIAASDLLAMDSRGDIRVEAGHDESLDEAQETESGWFSGGSLYAESESLEGQTTRAAVSSTIEAGSIRLDAAERIELNGAEIQATDAFSAAAGEIDIGTAISETTIYTDSRSVTVGLDDMIRHAADIDDLIESEGGKLKLNLVRAEYETVDSTTHQTTATGSTIAAGTIAISAGGDTGGAISIEGSDLVAEESIALEARGDIAIVDAQHTQTVESSRTSGIATLGLTLQNEYEQVARSLEDLRVAERAVRHARDARRQFHRDLAAAEAEFEQLQRRFHAGEGFIEQADIDDYSRFLARLRENEEFYDANIALALTTLTSKSTALVRQTGRAAASSGTWGFNAGLELDIDALENQVESYYRQSRGSNLAAANISIRAGRTAAIRGSTLDASKSIDVDANDIEITAGIERDTTRETSGNLDYNHNWSLLGEAPGIDPEALGGDASGERQLAESRATRNVESRLRSASIRLNADQGLDIEGADIHAADRVEIDARNLRVASVQDVTTSEDESRGASASGSGGGLSVSDNWQETIATRTTRITGAEVVVKVQENTELRGATIASVDAEGRDNDKLVFATGTLDAGSMSNSNRRDNKGADIQAGETASVAYDDDATDTRTRTLATLGYGEIRIEDADGSDTRLLNTDIEHTDVAIYELESHRGLAGELDTRLLSSRGRMQIAEDWLRSGMIANTIEVIATTERVGIEDFFDQTDKYHRTYEAVKRQLGEDPSLVAMLQNPALTPAQKEDMLNRLVGAVMTELGFAAHDNLIIATDDFTPAGERFLGFYSRETGDAYLNDPEIGDTSGLVTTAGHEAVHAMDDRLHADYPGLSAGEISDTDVYADNFGENLSEFTDFALGFHGHDGLAISNEHIGNDATSIVDNTAEYGALDKSRGDYYLNYDDRKAYVELINQLFDCHGNDGCSPEFIASIQPEVSRLLKQDLASDQRIREACVSASSAACRDEVENVRQALHSYMGADFTEHPYSGEILSEEMRVGELLGHYRGEAWGDNSKRATVQMTRDTLEGTWDIGSIVVRAAAGNEEAIQQRDLILDGIYQFIKNPVDTIEENIASQLEEADRLRAIGKMDEAEQIESRVILEGAFVVSGGIGGALNVARSATVAATKIAPSKTEVAQFDTPDLLPYRELHGVGADVAAAGLPEGYRYVAMPDGDIAIIGPRGGLYLPTGEVDSSGNDLYMNSRKLYSFSSPNISNSNVASQAKASRRLDYSSTFHDDLNNFNSDYKHFSGYLEEELILVQYHRSDRTLGQGRSAAWWTTHSQANKFQTLSEVRKQLALPPDWGPRDSVSVARIPKGAKVEYYAGTASKQRGSQQLYEGGGLQFRFKEFDPDWIIETRNIPGIVNE